MDSLRTITESAGLTGFAGGSPSGSRGPAAANRGRCFMDLLGKPPMRW